MIQILLATYNGEYYVTDQLESLLAQTYSDWTVLVHDDGSTDRTLSIVQKYCDKYPSRFYLLNDDIRFGNSRDNFAHLLKASTADYLMFCDQDDIWLPNKVEKTFEAMRQMEAIHSQSAPIIVHSDLRIVDDSLNTLADSMFLYQGLQKEFSSLVHALAKNSVTGCTMMINRKAKEVSLPIPSCAMMHDWWVAAKVIQAGGLIKWIDESLILYRQHANNSVGAKKNTVLHLVSRMSKYALYNEVRGQIWQQAKAVDPSLKYMYFFAVKLSISVKSLF